MPTLFNTQRRWAFIWVLAFAILMGNLLGPAAGQDRNSKEEKRRLLLVEDIQHRVEPKAWTSLQEGAATAPFMRSFCSDPSWMEDFLDSGPVDDVHRGLQFLVAVWTSERGVQQRSAERSMATACALEFSRNKSKLEMMLSRYRYFVASHRAGLLNACFETLYTWERRFLARGVQWGMVNEIDGMVFLRDSASLPRSKYPKVCWRAPYRLHNGLGDSVHRSLYYAPFQGAYESRVQMVYDVGGVCGALSNSGASAAIANGIPAATMGEPGHCAYVVKTTDDTWTPSYSLSWKRSLHSFFYERSWSALMLSQRSLSDRVAMSMSGDLARQARSKLRRKQIKSADALFTRALLIHPLNHGLWLEWAEFGKKYKMSVAWWRRFHASLIAGLEEHQDVAWSILTQRVYPELLPQLHPNEQANLLFTTVESQNGWGRGRWNVAGSWGWMRSKLPKKNQGAFVSRVSRRMASSEALGSALASWVLSVYSKPGNDRENAMRELARNIGSGTKVKDANMKTLAKLVIPRAEADGDEALFQSFGRSVQYLSKEISTKGLKPFSGQLLSDGGLLVVSGAGNRHDSPQSHWGVIRRRGGICHTSKGHCSIAVRLECHARLQGLVIQNTPGRFKKRANGARVEISDDGKEWKQIATLEGIKTFYNIDLKERKIDCRWVRISKDTDYLHLNRFLVYGRRRS